MRLLSLLFISFFTSAVIAQDTFTKEELKHFKSFEGNQVTFGFDELIDSYIYYTPELKKLSTDVANAQIKLKSFIKLTKKGEDYCFSDIYFSFNVMSRGLGRKYNGVDVLIGFSSNIKKGDAIKYKFDLTPDEKGNATISGKEIREIIEKSNEINRPVTFNFYNNEEEISSFMIPYAKVAQKIGGIVATQKNLAEKFVLCEAM